MKPRRLILALGTTIGLISATGAAATEKLSLRVTPNVSNAPSNVIVKATIARHSSNRWLRIEADSGQFYRSSSIQLDGDKAPAVTEVRLSNLPSGQYAISAVLRDDQGDETTVRRTLIVLGRLGEP